MAGPRQACASGLGAGETGRRIAAALAGAGLMVDLPDPRPGDTAHAALEPRCTRRPPTCRDPAPLRRMRPGSPA